jgi:5-deoxy-glucuronate isomerase
LTQPLEVVRAPKARAVAAPPVGAHRLRPAAPRGDVAISVAEAGWRYLDFMLVNLATGTERRIEVAGREAALVLLSGQVEIRAGDQLFTLRRRDVFTDPPHVLYVPPGMPVAVRATHDAQLSLGSAPAEGRYPLRLFGPDEIRCELRGGGSARRQVNHLLSAPLPAERLILYEIVAPRGGWCGWPPHCHDGYDGSPYLEETYYFRFDRPEGCGLHRNYRVDEPFDEVFVVGDGDLVLVTKGYHTSTSAPGSHMYFLNYLAGELTDSDRARPPCFEGVHTWITDDWEAGELTLPTASAGRIDP